MVNRIMAENALIGKKQQPNDAELENVLGSAKEAWDRFLEVLADECSADIPEWKCYSQKSGWSLCTEHGARNGPTDWSIHGGVLAFGRPISIMDGILARGTTSLPRE